ncbi:MULTISPECIES: hypothetical protein [Pseudomonas]|uniref:Uncharacterized protein n=2 Tax=Pseudomonas TaxID=286 RepID=A0A2X2C9F5_PSELU|nr:MULTISPECIES: hypothetical protein [Pseudomonas]MBF8643069.1 hypothetical protein [Pseudomonas zeshuii]SER41473.1 hypothetical protein SAMN05216409_1202 [Pseudomonas lutea]SPZ05182.1 Uncharacterised protein [Pseudomonas luteola]
MAMYEHTPLMAQSPDPLNPDDTGIGGDVVDPGMPDDNLDDDVNRPL